MSKCKVVRVTVVILVAAWAAAALCAEAFAKTDADKQVNLLDNPGFEEVDEKGHALYWSPPGGWKKGFCEMETKDVHSGERAFSWKWRDLTGGKTVCNFFTTARPKMELPAPWNGGINDAYMPLWPGVTYTVSLWANGRGEIQPFFSTAEYGLQRGTKVLKAKAATPHWQQYIWTYTTPPDLIGTSAFLNLALRGREGDHLLIDDVALSCSEKDYITPQVPKALKASLKVKLLKGKVALTLSRTEDSRPSIRTMLGTDPETAARLKEMMRDRLRKKSEPERKAVQDYLRQFGRRQLTCPAGKTLELEAQEGDAEFAFEFNRPESRYMLSETILTLKCERAGEAGLQGELRAASGDRFPIDSTWVWAKPDEKDWLPLQKLADGTYWGEPTERRIRVKKHILWKDPYYIWTPDLKCVPISKENATILQFLLLQFHTWKADREQIVLDVPSGVEVLDKFEDSKGSRDHNFLPATITSEDITRDGRPYTRYVLSYENAFSDWEYKLGWYGWCPKWTPLVLTHHTNPSDEELRIYFRRQTADGVVQELWKSLPAFLLPEADGGRCKRLVIDVWGGYAAPFYHSRYSRAERDCVGRSFARVRSITFGVHAGYKKSAALAEEAKALFKKEGVRRVYWDMADTRTPNSGLWRDWFQEHPEYTWMDINGKRTMGRHCPTMMLRAAKENMEPFKRMRAECKKWHDLLGLPGAIHWEWHFSLGYPCYCPACKKAFAEYVGDPSIAELPNKEIKERYGKYLRVLDGTAGCVERYKVEPETAWNEFTVRQWGRLFRAYTDVLHEFDSWFYLHNEGSLHTDMRWKGVVDALHVTAGEADSPGWMLQTMEGIAALRRYYRGSTDTRISATIHCHEPPDARINKNKVVRAAILSQGGAIDVQGGFGVGGFYYLAEGTRFVAKYEDYFWKGEIVDYLFQIDRPKGKWNALQVGKNILLILFNDGPEPMTVPVHYKGLEWRKKIHI